MCNAGNILVSRDCGNLAVEQTITMNTLVPCIPVQEKTAQFSVLLHENKVEMYLALLNMLIPENLIALAPARDTNSLLSGHNTTTNYFTSQQDVNMQYTLSSCKIFVKVYPCI